MRSCAARWRRRRKSLPTRREVGGNRFDPGETTQSGQRSSRRQPRCRTNPSPYAARPRAAACTRSPRRGPSPKGVVELEPKGGVERETHRSPESQPKERRLAYGGQRIGQVPAQWNRLGARTHPTLPPDHHAGDRRCRSPLVGKANPVRVHKLRSVAERRELARVISVWSGKLLRCPFSHAARRPLRIRATPTVRRCAASRPPRWNGYWLRSTSRL
jgi:hypothetical protein